MKSNRRALLAAGFGISLALLAGCGRDPQTTAAAGHQASSTPAIRDIVSYPNSYNGKSVTVTGEVEEVYGPRAMQIDGRGVIGDEILVLNNQPWPQVQNRPDNPMIGEDDEVRISGIVRIFHRAEIERDFGNPFEGGREWDAEWENKPVLIAKSVTITPKAMETTTPGTGITPGTGTGTGEQPGTQPGTQPRY